MIYLQIFIWYYPLSTGMVLYWYLTRSEQLKKEFPVLSMFPESIMLLSILFTGWLACPLMLHTFWIEWRIKRTERKIEKIKEDISKIEAIKTSEKFQNLFNHKPKP